MPIQAITIDFWNTLYDSRGGEGRDKDRFTTIMTNAERLGHSIDAAQLKAAQKAAWEHFNVVWREEKRTPSTRSMVQFLWENLAIAADAKALDEVTTSFEEGILQHPPSLLPGARETVMLLAESHYIALISDTAFSPGRVLKRIMERDGIAQYFSAFSFSDETGVSKPHEIAYSTALKGASCAPESAVHIGDIERTDIEGAKNYGMKAILFAGDPNARMNDEHKDLPTRADARAEAWADIPRLVQIFQ
ncbi:MAG: HAD family hydrolase [Candidatus Kapabacteria bacterium]|jgi:putative hydrolase of the HAD superfamily|nr:HAD family hydrolase [Candidatus Kapabacteria bacterium]